MSHDTSSQSRAMECPVQSNLSVRMLKLTIPCLHLSNLTDTKTHLRLTLDRITGPLQLIAEYTWHTPQKIKIKDKEPTLAPQHSKGSQQHFQQHAKLSIAQARSCSSHAVQTRDALAAGLRFSVPHTPCGLDRRPLNSAHAWLSATT